MKKNKIQTKNKIIGVWHNIKTTHKTTVISESFQPWTMCCPCAFNSTLILRKHNYPK